MKIETCDICGSKYGVLKQGKIKICGGCRGKVEHRAKGLVISALAREEARRIMRW
jgi:hypothetical protein